MLYYSGTVQNEMQVDVTHTSVAFTYHLRQQFYQFYLVELMYLHFYPQYNFLVTCKIKD